MICTSIASGTVPNPNDETPRRQRQPAVAPLPETGLHVRTRLLPFVQIWNHLRSPSPISRASTKCAGKWKNSCSSCALPNSVSASEFVEMYVGVGAKRVRDLFGKAREHAPCVIFLDELDAVGRKRTTGLGGSDEREQTLNQLLVELDGFATRQTIVVLAATNRADILDPALLRPGRFDRHISVSLPDRAGRQAILQVHMRRTPLHEEVSLERLARLTTGMSGADLANLVNEAALCAARRNLERITSACFEEALARVLL